MQLPSVVPYRAGEDFEKRTRGVERYLAVVNITKADRKCAILLHLVGPDIADLSETLTEDDPTGDSFERLKKKLTAYLSPVKNVVAERAAYHQMKMQADEEFEQFLGRLRMQAQRCGYTAAEMDRELRDRCIVGSSLGLREKLLQEAATKGDGLTLANVRQTARAYRDMRQLSAQLRESQPAATDASCEGTTVNAVRPDQPRRTQRGQCYRCGSKQHWKRDCPVRAQERDSVDRQSPGDSGRREERRPPGQARRPPPVRRCFRCGSEAHLQRSCPQRRAMSVDHVTEDDSQQRLELLQIDITSERDDLPLVAVMINGQRVKMMIDTGSPVTIVGRDINIPGLRVSRPNPSSLTHPLTTVLCIQLPAAARRDPTPVRLPPAARGALRTPFGEGSALTLPPPTYHGTGDTQHNEHSIHIVRRYFNRTPRGHAQALDVCCEHA